MLGRKGFTLVELLVVIGICGLLFTIAYPSLSKLRQTVLLEGECQSLAADLRRTQIEALTGAKTVERLTFKFAGTGFPFPGYSGTLTLSPYRKIVVSSVGRIRVE